MKTRHAMVAAALLTLAGIGCGGSAHSRAAEESTASDGAAAGDTGGDNGDDNGDTGGARATSTTTTGGGEAMPPPTEPQMPGEGPDPMVAASEEWNAMLEADRDLRASLELAQPDCGAAGEHVERLCELAERICEIAEDTGDPGAGDRCTDGTARCERGRTRYADRCD